MDEPPPLSSKISVEDVQKSINGAVHGRYSPHEMDLGEFAKDEARRLAALETARRGERPGHAVTNCFVHLWRVTLGRWGEDWVFLALLGTLMAMLSYAMDEIVALSFRVRLWLFHVASIHVALQYLAWISFPVTVMVGAALLVGKTAPQAAGSGLPELKAILRGGSLQGYFGFKTLIAKTCGITATLGCGMPLGREGSLIHISSIMAALLSKLVGALGTLKDSAGMMTWRYSDMLAAACAVGVATTFAAPIGGVLFSIEVTSVYFAVRNYWRGFFAAVFGAVVFRLLAVWFAKEDTVVAIYLTSFSSDFPFDPQELFAYALLGVVSGLGAAAYVWMHRQCITFVRTNRFIQQHIYLFVACTVLLTVSLTFPAGLGQFMGGDIYTVDQVKALFQNFTWTKDKDNLTVTEADVLSHWNVDKVGVFSSLGMYIVFTWLFSILCSSMPVPLGNFGPVFKMGAAIGRLVGELLLVYSPTGFQFGKIFDAVVPGAYATVGAAAFSGAVTHTVSTSVIVFEMTGQVTHVFPNMIAVLIANGICAMLQPSIYDSLILIKKLPYLPHLFPKSSSYLIYVKDFMVRNVKYIWHGITYGELLDLINENENVSNFPLVNSPEDMILVGSVQRKELQKLIDQHLGDERRLYVAAQRRLEAIERKNSHNQLKTSSSSGDLMGDALLMQRSYENLVPLPSQRHSDSGLINPIFNGDDANSIRVVRKSQSFTLPQVVELPEFDTSEHHVHEAASNIADSARRARETARAMRRSNSSSVICTDPDPESNLNDKLQSLHDSIETLTMTSPLSGDMTADERRRWEAAELRRAVPLGLCTCVDPAPFQLVVTKPLPRVHSLFCMLGVRRAFVTHVGRLVGVVTLKELCRATVDSNAGVLPVLKEDTGKLV